MSVNSLNEVEGSKGASSAWGAKRVLLFTSGTTLISALFGLIFGLGLGIAYAVDELFPAAAFSTVYGGFVGFIAGLLFSSIRKLRHFASGSILRTTAVFALLGALPGALLLGLFSEGLAMMLFQAFSGAIHGGVISGITGILVGILRKGP